MALSTIFQLYHGLSWVSYQYYWSLYPGTSKSVEMLTPQRWAPKRAVTTTVNKVFISIVRIRRSRVVSVGDLEPGLPGLIPSNGGHGCAFPSILLVWLPNEYK